MATEIELKFSLEKENDQKFFEWIEKNADFVKEIHHKEVYLDNPTDPFLTKDEEGYLDTSKFLRIRFTKDGDSMCLKDFHPDPDNPGKHTHCDEYEYNVSNGQEALNLMKGSGFTNEYWMKKYRKKYKYNEFEIVLDDIEDLGVFFEIEYQGKEEDPKEVMSKIKKLLSQTGIKTYRSHRRGYISMIINEGYDFGEDVNI